MEDVKNWLTSKTVWVGIIGFGLQIATIFGVSKDVISTIDPSGVADQVVSLASAVLFLGAIITRLVAKKKLTA